MDTERIKEIQEQTAYPNSVSVKQALVQVWNECEQSNKTTISGGSDDFEKELFNLVNDYCKKGLKKPDLVKKMEWVLGSCKMS